MVSFIIPIYNAAPFLQRCVQSVLAQENLSGETLQIILVDDGSTDDSLSIANRIAVQEQAVQVISQTHAGQSAARNSGLERAEGDYIAFVDADDWIAPDWLAQHLAAIDGVDYVQSGHPKNKYQYTVVWGRLYRRKAIEGLRFQEGMIYEDVLWSVDLWLTRATCRITDYCGYHYTRNPDSTTSQPHPDAQRKVIRELIKRSKKTSWRGKCMVWHTIFRLKIHFLLS